VARLRWVKNKCFALRMPVFTPGQEEKWLTHITELVAVIKLNRPAFQQVMAGFPHRFLGCFTPGDRQDLPAMTKPCLSFKERLRRCRENWSVD
jgi:hypothetical protein